MGMEIPLGRIAGIKVGMHATTLLMVSLITAVLAAYRYPILSPDLSNGWFWAAGVASAFLLFLSLLVHELGHALVARDEGIGVVGMALTPLGGVTRMETSPSGPGAEFRVSVVGPIASAACGVVFLAGAYLLPDGGAWGLAGHVFAWVGIINLILAALNALPGAPLDGGKVLSSLIWRGTGSQSTAMAWAAGSGVVIGMAMVTWGIRELREPFGRSDLAINALVIGAFIGFGAFQQLRSAPLFRALDGIHVAAAMEPTPTTAPAWISAGDFVRATGRLTQRAYPVVAPDGQVSGLLTAAAVRAVPPETLDGLAVTDLAYPLDRLTMVRPEDGLLVALQKLEGGDVALALVVSADGRIVGTLDHSALDQAIAADKDARQRGGDRQPAPV